MSIDRLRIEPLPPVRARGPQGPSAQQERTDAPFAHVLARAESDPARSEQRRHADAYNEARRADAARNDAARVDAGEPTPHDAAPNRVACGGATHAADTADQTDQPQAAETAAVDASEHDSERDKRGQAQAPDQARAPQGHASRPNRPTSTSPDSRTGHCATDSVSVGLASTDASGAAQDPDSGAAPSTAKPEPKSSDDSSAQQTTAARPDASVLIAQPELSLPSLAQAQTPAHTGSPTAPAEEDDAAQEVGDPLGRSPRRARARDAGSDDAQGRAHSARSAAETTPGLADSQSSRAASDRASDQAKTVAALTSSLDYNGRAALEQAAPASPTATFEQSLRAAMTAQPSSLSAAPTPSFPITVPFGESRFGAAFGERINWMVREGLQNAELVLNPPDMGPIRVALSLANDAATFSFNAPQADTRAAIEQSLPRLRELLAEQGVTLGETHIDTGAGRQGDQGSQSQSGQTRPSTSSFLSGQGTPGELGDEPPHAQSRTRARAAGRIDLFA